MFSRIVKFVLISAVAVKLYRYWYERMLGDKEYLTMLCRERRESDHEHLVRKTLEEARGHEERGEFDMALEYYLYAFRALRCDRNFIMGNVLTEEVRGMLGKTL